MQEHDLHHVPPAQADIDEKLRNWGRWCHGGRGPGGGGDMSPMFRLFRSSYARASYGATTAAPSIRAPEAMKLEAIIRGLPDLHCGMLRGWYAHNAHPGQLARMLGVKKSSLPQILGDARRMVAARYSELPDHSAQRPKLRSIVVPA